MARWGLVIDLEKCTGCQACVIACKSENNIPFSPPEEAEYGRRISWLEILTTNEGHYPDLRVRYLPRPCFHCENPPCTRVCPVFATYKNPEGIVAQIYPRCIGCRYCANACPYTVKYFNWFPPAFPRSYHPYLNPDVSVRPKGVIEKCTLCHHRLQKAKEQARAEERDFREQDYVPACVAVCPTKALIFGDLDNPESPVSKLRHSYRAFRLLEELGTEPKVWYLSEKKE